MTSVLEDENYIYFQKLSKPYTLDLEKIKQKINSPEELKELIGKFRGYELLRDIMELFYHNNTDSDTIDDFLKFYFGEDDNDLNVFKMASRPIFDEKIIEWLCKILSVTFTQTMEAVLDFFERISTLNPGIRILELQSELANPILSGASFYVAAEKILKYTQSDEVIDFVSLKHASLSLSQTYPEVYSFFEEMCFKYSDYAPIPEWVEFSAEELDPDLVEEVFTQEPLERETHAFLSCLKNPAEIEELIQFSLKIKPYNVEDPRFNLDRCLGLQNPKVDQECNQHRTRCRMLSCDCHAPEESSWFTGRCLTCSLPIRHPSHALRYPLPTGGFANCYCSEQCLLLHLYYLDGRMYPEEHMNNPDFISPELQKDLKRIEAFLKILKEVKIISPPFLSE